jgi:hypothetical protein
MPKVIKLKKKSADKLIEKWIKESGKIAVSPGTYKERVNKLIDGLLKYAKEANKISRAYPEDELFEARILSQVGDMLKQAMAVILKRLNKIKGVK